MLENDSYVRPETSLNKKDTVELISIIAFVLIICSAHLIDAKEGTHRLGQM